MGGILDTDIKLKFEYNNQIYDKTCEPGLPDIGDKHNCNFKCYGVRL